MNKELLNTDLQDMLGREFSCDCGKVHGIDIKNIYIGPEISEKIIDILSESNFKNPFIIEDINTEEAAGKRIEEILSAGYNVKKHVFPERHLVPDEKALGRLLVEIPVGTDVIIAVGSGTINDLSRYMSYKLGIPYVIVCTAPSMDGYASVVSPLITDNVKITYNAVYPLSILADTDVMRKAPLYMLQAGLGDVIGKYTAIADWKLSRLLNREYYCETISEMVERAVKKCTEAASGISGRKEESIRSITEALIFTGLAIGMTGTSRPASGEEHHFSHCLEMMTLNSGEPIHFLHGNNVGVGTVVALEAYKYLRNVDVNTVINEGRYRELSEEKWENNLREIYGRSAPNIIESKRGSISFDNVRRESNINKIAECWDDIMSIAVDYVPDPLVVSELLRECGAVSTPQELGLNRETFIKSLIAAKDIRNRYGVFQLLEDLGQLETAAETIAQKFYI